MSDDITFVSDEARRVFIEILDNERREELARIGYGCGYAELSDDQRRGLDRVMKLEDRA